MKLEYIGRSFSPASVSYSERVSSTTDPDRMNKMDMAASLCFLGEKYIIGLQLYLAKMKINTPDISLEYLYQIANEYSDRFPSLKKIKPSQRQLVLNIICASAFEDYARSAASTRPCNTCNATGFVEAEVFTNRVCKKKPKSPPLIVKTESSIQNVQANWRQMRDVVPVLCQKCNGKGYLSNACQCRGRGEVINRKKTQLAGIPVMTHCTKCQGMGYTRLRFCVVLERLKPVWTIGKNVAYREIKPLFDMLVARCHAEESEMEKKLKKSHKYNFNTVCDN